MENSEENMHFISGLKGLKFFYWLYMLNMIKNYRRLTHSDMQNILMSKTVNGLNPGVIS